MTIIRRYVVLMSYLGRLCICAFVMLQVVSFAQEDEQPRGILESVTSEDLDVRVAAAESVSAERERHIRELMDMLRASKEFTFNHSGSVEGLCVQLLGELRAAESVELLIDRLIPLHSVVVFTHMGPNLARVSLVKIGMPAVDPLINTIATCSDVEAIGQNLVREATETLVCILGYDLALAKLQLEQSATENAVSAASLNDAVAVIEATSRREWERQFNRYNSTAHVLHRKPTPPSSSEDRRPRGVVEVDLEAAAGDPDEHIRRIYSLHGAELLPAQTKYLIDLYANPEAALGVRVAALRVLGQRDDMSTAFVESLTSKLENPAKLKGMEDVLVSMIVTYFGNSAKGDEARTKAAGDALCRLAEGEPSPVSDAAFVRLAYLHTTDAIPSADQLRELIRDRIVRADYRTSMIAMYVARTTNATEQLPAVRQVIDSESTRNPAKFHAAIKALGQIGEAQDLKKLMALASHKDAETAETAARALQALKARLQNDQ